MLLMLVFLAVAAAVVGISAVRKRGAPPPPPPLGVYVNYTRGVRLTRQQFAAAAAKTGSAMYEGPVTQCSHAVRSAVTLMRNEVDTEVGSRLHHPRLFVYPMNFSLVTAHNVWVSETADLFLPPFDAPRMLDITGWPPSNVGCQCKQRYVRKLLIMLQLWSSPWQHFVQDMTDRIGFLLPLIPDPEMYVMAHGTTYGSKSRDELIRALGISEDQLILRREYGSWYSSTTCNAKLGCEIIHAETVYVAHKTPDLVSFSCGTFVQKTRAAVAPHVHRLPASNPRNLVLFVNRNRTRERSLSPESTVAVSRLITRWAHEEYGDDVEVMTVDDNDFRDGLSGAPTLFSRALAVLGPHGGWGYNMLFARPGTLFMEFVPTRYSSHDLERFIGALGDMDYRILLLPGVPRSSHDIVIPLDLLDDLLHLRGTSPRAGEPWSTPHWDIVDRRAET